MKNKVKKKPTAKEMASAIIEINGKTNELYKVLRDLDGIVGLYIEMKGDKDKFNAYLEKVQEEYQEKVKKENDKKANGKADNLNLQGDTDGEGSRAEGIRQESK